MVKYFYELQSYFERNNLVLLSKVSYRILLFLIRLVIPLNYKLRPIKDSGIRDEDDVNKEPQIIISLTSFPKRMTRIWMVLESLLRQTHKPDKIILWLASSQFPSIDDIDIRVRRMQKRGLEIRFCEDYKSHKKYYYTMQEFRNDLVITVDDDIFYPENMVENLLSKHKEYPECVVCFRAHQITLSDKKVNNYSEWDFSSRRVSGPDHLLMPTGCGGVLYPPNCLNNEVFNDRAIIELCPNADDIWLKCMAFMNRTKTVKVYQIYSEMFSVKGSDETGLAKSNVNEGHNDIQLKNVMDRYDINFSSPKD